MTPPGRGAAAAGTLDEAEGLTVEVDSLAAGEWDRIVADFDDASYDQTACWVDGAWGPERSSHLLLRAGGVAVAGARVIVLGLPGIGRGLAYVKFGPLWRRRGVREDPEIHRAAVAALVDEYCRRRGHGLTILPRPHPRHCGQESTSLAALGFTVRRPMADPNRYLVDLALDPDLRLRTLDQKWRYNLRHALRQGITCGLADGTADVAGFERLHAAMVDRKRFADDDRLELVPRLSRELPAPLRPHLVLARHEGRVIAGALVGVCGDTAFYVYGASDAAALPLRAGYALQWWIVDWLSRQGARWYDLGGEAGEAGLRQFKKGLVGKGGTVVAHPGELDRWTSPAGRLAADCVYALRAIRRILRGTSIRRSTPGSQRPATSPKRRSSRK